MNFYCKMHTFTHDPTDSSKPPFEVCTVLILMVVDNDTKVQGRRLSEIDNFYCQLLRPVGLTCPGCAAGTCTEQTLGYPLLSTITHWPPWRTQDPPQPSLALRTTARYCVRSQHETKPSRLWPFCAMALKLERQRSPCLGKGSLLRTEDFRSSRGPQIQSRVPDSKKCAYMSAEAGEL